MPARTLPVVDLRTAIANIFDQVQNSTANHLKNFVALHKLHLDAARTKGLPGEREFEAIFQGLVARVLPVKKGVAAADRVTKFVGGYTKFLNERAADEREDQDDDSDEATDTTASRFTERLLLFLMKGFQAKDKSVRYRVISFAGEMILGLGELDLDIYNNLQQALLARIHDKEATVRLQVVIALSKLAGSEDSSEVAEGEQTLLQVLIDTLSSDSSPEVRRAALVNIPVNTTTLPAILARARDTETTIRKLLYSNVLSGAASDAADPEVLTIAQRELLVRHGLGDREKTVRAAAAELFGTWIDVIGEKPKPEEELASRMTNIDISKTEEKPPLTLEEKQQKKIKTLVAFLNKFDPQLSAEGARLASEAVTSIFDTRPDIFDDLYFGDAYFADLTPEKAFLARVFVDHCKEDKDRGEQKIESGGIPVVTSCAFRIQHGYNALVTLDEAVHQDDDGAYEDNVFILGELLKLAVNLDYSDEIGRRKMFALVRDMLTSSALPLAVVPQCLDVLRQLSSNERDLIRVVVEIVGDLREPGDEDDPGAADQTQDSINPDDAADQSFDSEQSPAPKKPAKTREEMSPEERVRLDLIDKRCLILCIGMLERVNGTIEENSTLEGVLHDLIIPSVRRKEEEFREKGLIALGLFCLIAKNFALKTLPLFVSQAEEDVPEELKISLLQIIFDLLMVHERTLLAPGGENAQKILSFLITQLEKETDKEDTSPKVLALLGTGIAKLLLCGMVADERVVKSLLMVYFSPYNVDNQELKQCLTFFAHMYSRSTAKNQQTMREIFIYIFQKLSKLRDEEDLLSLASVANMWIEWTDPTQVQDPNGRPGDAGKTDDPLIQFDMANDIIRALLTDKMPKEDKRILCQMLPKLYIPDEVDVDKIRTLKLLIDNVSTRRPLSDATANNALKKFDATIQKKFEKELEGFSEGEYREFKKLQELFDFLDEIVPEDDDEVIDTEPKKKGKKRRSGSIASTTTDGDDASVASSRRGKSRPQKKRRRLSTSDDEDSDSDDDDRTAKGTPPPPTRRLPKRAAAKKEVILISSDDDEEEEDLETTPAPRKGRPRASSVRTRKAKEEAILDADIDDLLDGEPSTEIPHDSIMDDSEDEEDEVNDLLVED
ncbi:nuclear condensing complex subunit [Mycena albidolilacea]|uniref:Nuclear condensing complex subunit n=1 Tax=Mycena albidolilacea TaxID=1033008 RepID=A0AAD7EW70_9AGAR|nr:nuclear condensing complex subunit [Mycena albidolilacea]